MPCVVAPPTCWIVGGRQGYLGVDQQVSQSADEPIRTPTTVGCVDLAPPQKILLGTAAGRGLRATEDKLWLGGLGPLVRTVG